MKRPATPGEDPARSEQDPRGLLLEEACRALGRGWVLVPTAAATKRPAVRWRDRPPFTLEVIARAVRFGCGVAIRTGSRDGYRGQPCGGGSGIVVIDIDTDRGGQGDPAWAPTWTVATPSGGEHRYYEWHDDDTIPSRTDVLADGIDVRARGGIALLPGSLHTNGGVYRWARGLSPTDLALEPLPEELAVRLRERPPPPRTPAQPPCVSRWIAEGRFAKYADVALRCAIERITTAAPGARNDVLNREAYGVARIVGAGVLPFTQAMAALTPAARSTGLGDREIAATLRSAMRAGMARPVDLVLLQGHRAILRRGIRRRVPRA